MSRWRSLGGLLGIAFDPNYTSNRFVYLYYTEAFAPKHQIVMRFTANAQNPDVAVPHSDQPILWLDNNPQSSHIGGAIHFGADGKLYIPDGDNVDPANAQNLEKMAGKILRINPDGTVPADNPFAGVSGVQEEIWAWGFRNPFSFAVQPGTGRIFINDVGSSNPQRREEINELKKGGNYGWPIHEGYTTAAGYESPVFAYDASFGGGNCSISGGAFYNPTVNQFPSEYTGKYFFSDLCGGWIYTLDPDAADPAATVKPFATGLTGFPVDMRVGPDGSLYYLAHAKGEVRRISHGTPQAIDIFAVAGATGRVQVRQVSTGELVHEFAPFEGIYMSSVAVALGDINNDGFRDLIASTRDGTAKVRVFDGAWLTTGTLSVLAEWSAFADEFQMGANVAVGDVNNDGYDDIIAGATAGNPQVRVFDGIDIANGAFQPDASLLTEFFAYGMNFNVGANVAAGDINRDGFADIITGASAGNPHVQVYSGKDIATDAFQPDTSRLASWFAYGLSFNVGANVSTGDVDGDGYLDIITGATTGNPHVRVYDGKGIATLAVPLNTAPAIRVEFFAYELQFNVGVAIASADFDGDGKADLLTGATVGAPHYRVVRSDATGVFPPALNGIEGIPPDWAGGITVAA